MLLILAVISVVYALLPAGRGLWLHGRLVSTGCSLRDLCLISQRGRVKVRRDGRFRLGLAAGGAEVLGIHWKETLLACIRAEANADNALRATSNLHIDIGVIDVDLLRNGAADCRILHTDPVSVILAPAGRRVAPVEHQMLDRALHWLEQASISQDKR